MTNKLLLVVDFLEILKWISSGNTTENQDYRVRQKEHTINITTKDSYIQLYITILYTFIQICHNILAYMETNSYRQVQKLTVSAKILG